VTPILRLCAIALAVSCLAGCAYKPLKAPCSADEGGTALSFAEQPQPRAAEAFTALDSCGPMRPI